MKYIAALLNVLVALSLSGQPLDPAKLASLEEKLDDVMEIIDPDLVKEKLIETEAAYQREPTDINKLRVGLVYHEVAFNLTFLDKTEEYAGYAQRSFDVLTELAEHQKTSPELMVFVQPYRASALSLVSGETRKLKLLDQAFAIFEKAVDKYADISPRPEFMRGSVAENLPWFMGKKRQYAEADFASIIRKYEQDPTYADFRIMSFSYWAWANAHQKKKHREQAVNYLNKAIQLDPNYQAGRQRAEALKSELTGK